MSYFDALVREAARRSIPIDVSLELTDRCDHRCLHCYIPDSSGPDALPRSRILLLLTELAEVGTLFLCLTGGDLFLRRDWYPIAVRARELGFALRILSNGSRIDREIADQVASLAAAVEITVFSMNPQTFEAITRTPGSFDKTMRGIEMLSRRSVDLALKVPIMTLNADSWQGVETFAQSIGAACGSYPSIYPRRDGDPGPTALRVPSADLPECFRDLPSENRYRRAIREDEPLCAAASRHCTITSCGDVMACGLLPGSGGNLRERGFRDIWENSPWLEQVRSIRKRDLHTCGSCERLSYCGRCHAQALVEDGDLYGPSVAAKDRADALDLIAGEE